MIALNSITLQRAAKVLFQDVSLTLYNGQRVGVVGKNGCGKTSLFLLLLNELESTTGEICLPTKLSIVTVEQEIRYTQKSAIEYVIDANKLFIELQKKLEEAVISRDGYKIAELHESIQHIGGFTLEAKASKILKGLGFSEEQMNHSVNALSGGWRMRLNIARALFVPSDVLLLDEPTNHLDLDALIFLERWLQKYSGLLLLISHDREFLDHITSHTLHIENQKMKLYTGNYSDFEKERAETFSLQTKQYEKQKKQIEHIEAYIKRFRAKASKASQAQSRIKALEKMQRIMPAHVDSPFSFTFKKPKNLSSPLMTMERVSFSYQENLVLDEIDFQLNAGERVALLGRNGAGKSTFIKLLAGEFPPKSGKISTGSKIKTGYFTQHALDKLNENRSALEHLKELAKTETELNLRKYLGGFHFIGDMALMPVKNFSGGEKARLSLALIIWQAPNVLLLDEPTNHLDIDMRQALILALQNYEGVVVMVSHDRFLLNQVVDHYYLIADKSVRRFEGGVEAYQSWLMNNKLVLNYDAKKDRTFSTNNSKQYFLKKREIKKIETKIVSLQKEIADLDQALIELSANKVKGSDKNKINTLRIRRSKVVEEFESCEKSWFQEVERLEEIKS